MIYKKIGITGSTGVLGSYILKNFKNAKFDCFKGDISKKKDIQSWLKNKKFDGVFHLAALVPVDKVNKNYKKALKINYEGTKYLIDEIIKQKVCKWFLFSSTSHVYNFSNRKIKEDFKPRPVNLYGKTKLKAEKYLQKKSKKINICIARIFSYTHRRQKINFLIPSIFKKIKIKKIQKFERLNHSRDFVHIFDINSSFQLLFKKKSFGIFNIASGKSIKISFIAEYFAKKFKSKIFFKEKKIETIHKASIEKIKKLGWRPKKNIYNILKDFINKTN